MAEEGGSGFWTWEGTQEWAGAGGCEDAKCGSGEETSGCEVEHGAVGDGGDDDGWSDVEALSRRCRGRWKPRWCLNFLSVTAVRLQGDGL